MIHCKLICFYFKTSLKHGPLVNYTICDVTFLFTPNSLYHISLQNPWQSRLYLWIRAISRHRWHYTWDSTKCHKNVFLKYHFGTKKVKFDSKPWKQSFLRVRCHMVESGKRPKRCYVLFEKSRSQKSVSDNIINKDIVKKAQKRETRE